MIAPPPSGLTHAELARLELVALPAPDGFEADFAYRIPDSGEFVADDTEARKAIRAAFPDASVRLLAP